jgi:hypothetical protein
MGYVGRNSETELGRWVSEGLGPKVPATSTTVDCYFVEWFVQDMQSAVRPRAGFRTSPERARTFRLWRVQEMCARAERQELPCIEPE